MRRLLSIISFVLVFAASAFAQQGWISSKDLSSQDKGLVSNVKFTTDGDKVMIGYSLDANNADVSLYISLDGGNTYSGPLFYVSGDAGRVAGSGRKVILWDVLSEFGGIDSDKVRFFVLAKGNNLTKKPTRLLIKAGMGLGWFMDTELGINAGLGVYDIAGSRFGVDVTFYAFPSVYEDEVFYSLDSSDPFTLGLDASVAIRFSKKLYAKAGAGWIQYSSRDWKANGLTGNVSIGFLAKRFYVEAGARVVPKISVTHSSRSYPWDDLNASSQSVETVSRGGPFPFICIGYMF